MCKCGGVAMCLRCVKKCDNVLEYGSVFLCVRKCVLVLVIVLVCWVVCERFTDQS